ncbi:FeoC-like transcriptional regulator [Marichromatium gracile]|uniref:FeoC-like transcriptional regulator n=1 Tax=Marichromatium gracile TaxID=1048 RepID=A0A4R4ADK8_MARGR|nr:MULTISPECIES: FeoC-like transcriptional regulator [Marichromatium]KXX65052.1 sugar metabolism transcriptional regulator [Marichromatium gracile]MBK1710639.1 sugar metabolism transcriptional regulator [Marichromatium gracile]MCF1182721.1 FeoC-like transcriptional regulator [Marichromatium gracile]RNE90577.1 sugar metabolism transcriptional regulator [Marichromatium sp. AB31]TCW37157.1 FeoC-like transcriptional regulator [Marichromatium gracile]
MIMSDLTSHLRTQGRAALRDLSYRFDTDPEALRGMLELLERKGRVRKLPGGTPCSGCCSCDPTAIELYEWVG